MTGGLSQELVGLSQELVGPRAALGAAASFACGHGTGKPMHRLPWVHKDSSGLLGQAGVRSLELVAPEAAPGAATPALAAMVEASLCVCLSTLCPALEAVALAGCYASDTVVAALLMRRPFTVQRLRLRQAAGSGAVHMQLLSNARLASAPPG